MYGNMGACLFQAVVVCFASPTAYFIKLEVWSRVSFVSLNLIYMAEDFTSVVIFIFCPRNKIKSV
jgi:hypothetical protein